MFRFHDPDHPADHPHSRPGRGGDPRKPDGTDPGQIPEEVIITPNPILALVAGPPYSWTAPGVVGTPITVTYSFMSKLPHYVDAAEAPGFRAFTPAQQAAARAVFSHIAEKTGLSFIEVPDSMGGDIRLGFHRMDGPGGVGAYAYYPVAAGGDVSDLGGDLFLDAADVGAGNGMVRGSLGYGLLLHEIGHALGLKHPFSGAYRLPPELDNSFNTVMSYNWSHMPTQLGPYDVAALQHIYGSEEQEKTDTILTVWDAAKRTFFTLGGSGPEHLVGINHDDIIQGGAGNDLILGRAGNDVLTGGAGNDIINGGKGADLVRYSGSRQDYQLNHTPEGVYIIDNRPGAPDGIDAVLEAEYIAFGREVVRIGHEPPRWEAFNERLYLAQNPDVAAAVAQKIFASGADHFAAFGFREGRIGHMLLNQDFYLDAYPEVAAAIRQGRYRDAADHYAAVGRKEGKSPNALFDADWYLDRNPDVAQAVARGLMDPLQHYMAWGWREGRDPSPWFDTGAYLAANPDVAAAGMNPLGHFLLFGAQEGRVAYLSDQGWLG